MALAVFQDEVLGWNFSTEEPGKNMGSFWREWGAISAETEKLFRPVRLCIFTKGILFSLLIKSLEGFPPVEAA